MAKKTMVGKGWVAAVATSREGKRSLLLQVVRFRAKCGDFTDFNIEWDAAKGLRATSFRPAKFQRWIEINPTEQVEKALIALGLNK